MKWGSLIEIVWFFLLLWGALSSWEQGSNWFWLYLGLLIWFIDEHKDEEIFK